MSEDEVGDTAFGLQVSIGFVGEVATAVVGLLGSIVLARVLGPSGYGLFYVALAVANFFENPVNGWAVACKKRLTETDFDEREAVGSVLLVVAALAAVGAPITFVGLSFLTSNPLLPLVVPALFVSLSAYWSMKTLLSGRQNFALATWSKVVRTVLKVGLQIALVVLGFGVWGMVGGTAVAALVTVPLLYFWIGIRPSLPSRRTLGSIASFAKWSIPEGFVGTSLSKMDIVLLGWLASAGVAGDYRVSLALSIPAIFVSAVIGEGLMGRVSNLDSRDAAWERDLRNAISFSSILAVPIFVGSLVLADPLIVTVYSNQYSGAGLFLVGLALYQLLVTQTIPRKSVISGIDRPGMNLRISLVALVLNVTLGVGLWYAIGPIGIVAATVLTQGFAYITRIWAVSRLTGSSLLVTRPFLEQVVAGLLMGMVVWAARRAIGLDQWYAVAGLVCLGGLVYGIVLFAVSSALRQTARGIFADFTIRFGSS